MPEYHAVSDLLDTLTNVANAFESTNRGPQRRELARFFRSVYFDERDPYGVWQAFAKMNTDPHRKPVMEVRGLIRNFQDRQRDEVEPALSVINIREVVDYYRIGFGDGTYLNRLRMERDGLGRAIPNYLHWYSLLPDDQHKPGLINLLNRMRTLNRIIELVRNR